MCYRQTKDFRVDLHQMTMGNRTQTKQVCDSGLNANTYQVQKDKRIDFYSYVFILGPINVQTSSRKRVTIFSIVVHVFRNLF